MTVYIEKPAVNLREELASLRNQGGYQEQQFYFDSLVTNGTFDTDVSGWTNTNATIASVSSELQVSAQTGSPSQTTQTISGFVVGKKYAVTATYYQTGSGGIASRVSFFGVNSGNNSTSTPVTETIYVTATVTTATLSLQSFGTSSTISNFDNVSVFEVDANDDVIHTMPKGWKPKDVFEDGLLQREGAAHDYEVVYDGFDYFVKPTVAPSATTQTCVIGVKA